MEGQIDLLLSLNLPDEIANKFNEYIVRYQETKDGEKLQ